MKKQTDQEFSHGFGKMVKGKSSLLLEKDQLSDTLNMKPGYEWEQRKGMAALTASAIASGLRFRSLTQFRDLRGDTDVILAHTYDGSGGEDLYQGSALPPSAITWTKKYDLTASCEACQWANVAKALLVANNKDFLIWRGTVHFPTAVWKYNSAPAQYTIFADELFDNDTDTNMPLNGLNTDEYFTVLSEMPIDKVTIVGGDLNDTDSKLLGFVWTGAWIALTDVAGNVSSGTTLIADCSALGSWADGDNNNGVSDQTTYNGRQVFRFDTNAAVGANYAMRSQDIGAIADGDSFTFRVYLDQVGVITDNDHFQLRVDNGTTRCNLTLASDGAFTHDGATWNEIGTNVVVEDTWQEWTFVFNTTAKTIDLYLDGTVVATGVDCSSDTGATDGEVLMKLYGDTTNDNIAYVDILRLGGALETGDGFSDGTETSDACLGQSGDITWTKRTDEVQTDIQGIPGFAYKFAPAVAIANPTSVTGLTVHSPMAPVQNVWDGRHEFVSGCYVYDGTDHTDYMAYVNNTVETQYMDLSDVTTTDKIYVGFPSRVNKIIFYPAADGKNANNVSITSVKYHSAAGVATTVGTVTDTMETNNATFSQKGYLSWADPGWQNEKATIIGGDSVPMYWYEIVVDAALDATTYIYYIQGVPIPKNPDPSYGVFAYKRRAWQVAPRNMENMVRYSAQDLPNVWNGSDSGYIAFGERPLKVAGPFYNETMLYADTEMWMLQGNSPSNFGRVRLSAKVGIAAPKSLVPVESGVIVSDTVKVVLCWFFYDGIWMFDGVRIWKISAPDIDSFFDPDHSDYINPTYLDRSYGEYDFENQLALWTVYSGSGATTPTKVIALHFPTLNFGIFDYGTDIEAMLNVINGRYYMVGGGNADGRFYQLNSGVTDLVNGTATAVEAYVITRDEFLGYSTGLRERLMSVWTEAQTAGGQLELDEYPDGSKTPQNIAKTSMSIKGKIFGALQKKLKFFSGQKTTKFRIRNRSKNARMKLLGYSTTVDEGRSNE